jgi:sugar phosphate isomerase/epimerase
MNRRQLLKTIPALAAAAGVPASAAKTTARIRTGIVAYSFRKQFEEKRMTYEKLIGLVSDLGLDGLDTTVYWFPDTSDTFLAKLRATAYKNAVSLYSIAARIRLCQPTPELRQAEVETIKKWVDVAQKVGAAHIRVFGGTVPKGVSESQAISWAAEVLKRGADYSAARGIFLGVEDDGGLSTNAEPTVEIVRQAANPFAGVNIDVGNFPKNGYQQVEYCLPYAVNCHFKVNVTGPNGEKLTADWDRLVGMFARSGYKGYLSLEYEESGAAETDVPRYATKLRDTVRKIAG